LDTNPDARANPPGTDAAKADSSQTQPAAADQDKGKKKKKEKKPKQPAVVTPATTQSTSSDKP
jgi:hypothetical protein